MPAFSVPIVMPNFVLGLGDNLGILEDFNMLFIPNPIFGTGGFFKSAFSINGYCDKAVFIAFYTNMNGLPVLEAGIPASRLLSSSNDLKEKLILDNIADIRDYLANPVLGKPTNDDLQLLKPFLLEAHSSYPQYRELINIALELIDHNSNY
jgi:hypothetical protein